MGRRVGHMGRPKRKYVSSGLPSLPAAVLRIFKSPTFRPPADVLDVLSHWGEWLRVFSEQRGLLLLVIILKLPSARKFFVEGFNVSGPRNVPERVFHALVGGYLSKKQSCATN